jgi:ligand-binding SRPBCC domain-containing protein
MPTIILETKINASAETCFDLIRDVRIHARAISGANNSATAVVIDGVMGLGQTVTFEARRFGLRQKLTVRVAEFDRPRLLVDEMTEGAFRSFSHVHEFEDEHGGTLMRDTLVWESPFRLAGRIFDGLFLKRHLTTLVSARNAALKQLAEGGWLTK